MSNRPSWRGPDGLLTNRGTGLIFVVAESAAGIPGVVMIRSKSVFLHFKHLDKETRELFKDFFARENPMFMLGENHWAPNTDVYETAKGIVVKLELTGVPQDQIEILFQGNTMVVKGRRIDHGTAEKIRCLQLEINYGDFFRAVTLPAHLDFDAASARSQDGFLIVFVPFKKARKIKVE
jgi:HSP20 family protein